MRSVRSDARVYAPGLGVALACGLRLGEAKGLRWEDVDLTTGELRIRQQLQAAGKRLVVQDLKTEKSRRTLSLPQVCIEGLRAHHTQQLKERLKAGADWVETGLVFTTFARRGMGRKVGQPLHPRNVLRTLHQIIDDANKDEDQSQTQHPKLPRVRFHDLRHSAASLLIAEGVEPRGSFNAARSLRAAGDGGSLLAPTQADGREGCPAHGRRLRQAAGVVALAGQKSSKTLE